MLFTFIMHILTRTQWVASCPVSAPGLRHRAMCASHSGADAVRWRSDSTRKTCQVLTFSFFRFVPQGIFRQISDTVGRWFTGAPAVCNHSLKYRVVHADQESTWCVGFIVSALVRFTLLSRLHACTHPRVDEDFVRCSGLPKHGETSAGT